MPQYYKTFQSDNGKRLVLIVDDEPINREILEFVLQEEYELLFAEDGLQALDIIRTHAQTLSVVLLDLIMPGIGGLELLRLIREDPLMRNLPVIVMTSDSRAEVESLKMGANDFIPKPYPQHEVILARLQRTIELSEDRAIIQSTERDALTNLYNKDYFYRYAEQYDQYHRNTSMDAMVVDINHFHLVNERYGRAYGDEVLRRVAERLKSQVLEAGGIVCRRDGDIFLLYCPHGLDYEAVLDNASVGLAGDGTASINRVRLRMGVYSRVNKSIDIEHRFDRAKLAADTVRNSFTRTVGIYDSLLHESELYNEQLIEDFQNAIDQKQFRIFYQPKYDISGSTPVLSGAEALVRWQHPKLGMIAPFQFIPLFEENGLVQQLDRYVWNETAAQINTWKQTWPDSIPVSVNVSRVDMLDSDLLGNLLRILKEHRLTPADFRLEITESAYTDDSDGIVTVVNNLREHGFQIEMDDFGTGYSSLSMLSRLPIDTLKLDMAFIRNAFNEQRNTRMLELIIDIADYLSVPVIAEGVETREQMLTLKEMGCTYVQGYYFSKPVPPEEFVHFFGADSTGGTKDAAKPNHSLHATMTAGRIVRSLTRDFYSIYYVDLDTEDFVHYRFGGDGSELHIEKTGSAFFDLSRNTILRQAFPEDLDKALNFWEKKNLQTLLSQSDELTTSFRTVAGGNSPFCTNYKIVKLADDAQNRILIGARRADIQMQADLEYERKRGEASILSMRDTLTGVKSRHAFTETESLYNQRLDAREDLSFAVVVCDVNNLSRINETQGHDAGDAAIKDACKAICNTYKHSPVYRIGGGEFVIILTGQDYENRAELVGELNRICSGRAPEICEPVSVAHGMSEYLPDLDLRFQDVFARADSRMSENKRKREES